MGWSLWSLFKACNNSSAVPDADLRERVITSLVGVPNLCLKTAITKSLCWMIFLLMTSWGYPFCEAKSSQPCTMILNPQWLSWLSLLNLTSRWSSRSFRSASVSPGEAITTWGMFPVWLLVRVLNYTYLYSGRILWTWICSLKIQLVFLGPPEICHQM